MCKIEKNPFTEDFFTQIATPEGALRVAEAGARELKLRISGAQLIHRDALGGVRLRDVPAWREDFKRKTGREF